MRGQQGLFIVISGGPTIGVSTQARVLGTRLRNRGYSVLVTKEPGGDSFTHKIAKAFTAARDQDKDYPIDPLTEFFWICADRNQHVRTTLLPGLATHDVVICERYVPDTYAIQVHAEKALGESNDFYYIMSRITSNIPVPRMTFWLSLDPKISIKRQLLRRRPGRFDTFDEERHRSIQEGYEKFFRLHPEYGCVRVDASIPKMDIAHQIEDTLNVALSQEGPSTSPAE